MQAAGAGGGIVAVDGAEQVLAELPRPGVGSGVRLLAGAGVVDDLDPEDHLAPHELRRVLERAPGVELDVRVEAGRLVLVEALVVGELLALIEHGGDAGVGEGVGDAVADAHVGAEALAADGEPHQAGVEVVVGLDRQAPAADGLERVLARADHDHRRPAVAAGLGEIGIGGGAAAEGEEGEEHDLCAHGERRIVEAVKPRPGVWGPVSGGAWSRAGRGCCCRRRRPLPRWTSSPDPWRAAWPGAPRASGARRP